MLKQIFYVCPFGYNPVGGIKVILRHAAALDRVAAPVLRSFVYIPDRLGLTFDWFDHEAAQKRDHIFNPASDLIVLPEVMAHRLGVRLTALGIRYAIFVQNGYFLFPDNFQNIEDIAEVYARALLVLSISEDTTNCIERALPHSRARVSPIRPSVNPLLFNAESTKRNAIAYMPRKFAEHAHAVTSFLRATGLDGWEIVPIDRMSEVEVAATLRQTRIFLSFSDLEGLGLPPLEAALSGNLVVGYTGEGGGEYWTHPLFTKVEPGNIQQFVDRTLEVVRQLSSHGFDPITDPVYANARAELARTFSPEAEADSLVAFARQAAALFETEPREDRPVSLFAHWEISALRIEHIRQRLERLLVAGAKTALSHFKYAP